ncbi:MAG TPA: BamA/TamA family outer membrane protein [Blastocatellia bacterium]|nr:BamA/TamA family outer membrane protein [Blastocatellia bacterium]
MKPAALAILLALVGATSGFGQQFRLGRLDIMGNLKTKQSVILRMIPLEEGDIFDTTLWELGLELLNRSGLFEPISPGDVEMKFDPSRGVVDVVLHLRERDYQRVDFDAGGGTTGGASVGLQYSHINLTGRADRLSAQLRIGTRERLLAGGYSITTLTRIPITFDMAGSYQRFEFVDARTAGNDRRPLFVQRSAVLSFGASVPVAEPRNTLFARTRAGLNYSFTSNNVIDLLGQSVTVMDEVLRSDFRIASLTPFVTRDTLDRAFDPTSGSRLVIATELSARAFGGSINTINPSFDYRRFFRLSNGAREPRVFGLRARLSHVAGFGEPFRAGAPVVIGGVPVFRRFFVGGENEVRGYDVNSIAPLARIDRFVVTDGDKLESVSTEVRPVGGDTRFAFNAEYRLPLIWRLSAAAFFDFGASLNLRRLGEERFESVVRAEPQGTAVRLLTVLRPLDGESRLPDYRVSLGGELRMMIPVLNIPLRLIFAANPNAQRQPSESFVIAPEKRFAFRFGFSRTL